MSRSSSERIRDRDYREGRRNSRYRDRRRTPDSRNYSKHKYYSRSNSKERYSPRGRSRERRSHANKHDKYKRKESEMHDGPMLRKSSTVPMTCEKEIMPSISNPTIENGNKRIHKEAKTLEYPSYSNKVENIQLNEHSYSSLISPSLTRNLYNAYKNGNNASQNMPNYHPTHVNGFQPSFIPNFNPYVQFNANGNNIYDPNKNSYDAIHVTSPGYQNNNYHQNGFYENSEDSKDRIDGKNTERIIKNSDIEHKNLVDNKKGLEMDERTRITNFAPNVYPHPYNQTQVYII